MQSFHQDDYSYHVLKIPNNLFLLWATTKSDDSPTKANMFLSSLEEHLNELLNMSKETLSLGISKVLQKMIDNIEDYVDTNDKLNHMEYELTDITESMKENLTSVLARGEKFNVLMQKSETLKSSSKTFSSRAKKLKSQANWDMLAIIWIVIVILSMLFGIFYTISGIS